MTAASTEQVHGVGGRTFDLTFFFGSALLAYVLGALLVLVPSLVLPLWWAWVTLIEGPHLVATWARTYLDPEQRVQRRPLLLASATLIALGPVAWVVSLLLGRAEVLELFIGGAALWSVHHFVRQHYGILAVLGSHGDWTQAERRTDSRFLYTSLWGIYVLFLISNTQTRAHVGMTAAPTPTEMTIVLTLAGCLALASCFYVAVIVSRMRRGRRVLGPAYALCVAVGLTTFGYLVVGAAEPLVERRATLDHGFLGLSLVVGVCHGIQYLGLVAITSGRRARRRMSESLWKRAALQPWLSYACSVVVSASVWCSLNAGGGLAPNIAPLGYDTPASKLVLAVYWSLLIHHFYLDQKIWRIGDDASLRFDLNLQRAQA